MDETPTRPRASRWIEIVTGLVVLVIVAGVAAFYPPARDAVAGARRSIATLLGAADWTGYYLELDPTARPGEISSPQLLFAEGTFRGRGARVVDPPVFAGRWSPSGARFAFTSGRRLLLADKNGEIQSLGELLDLTPAGPPIWLSENELLLTMGRAQPLGRWYVRISASGALLDQRSLPTSLRIESASADGRYALARSSLGLELVDLSDGGLTRAPDGTVYLGWLSDGRLLLRTINAGFWRLEARIVGAKLGETLADMGGAPFEVSVRGAWIAILERDRAPVSPGTIWLVRPGSAAKRVLTDIVGLTDAQPSADGRYVGFTTGTADDPRARTGVVDVASGVVTYACEEGCLALRLR